MAEVRAEVEQLRREKRAADAKVEEAEQAALRAQRRHAGELESLTSAHQAREVEQKRAVEIAKQGAETAETLAKQRQATTQQKLDNAASELRTAQVCLRSSLAARLPRFCARSYARVEPLAAGHRADRCSVSCARRVQKEIDSFKQRVDELTAAADQAESLANDADRRAKRLQDLLQAANAATSNAIKEGQQLRATADERRCAPRLCRCGALPALCKPAPWRRAVLGRAQRTVGISAWTGLCMEWVLHGLGPAGWGQGRCCGGVLASGGRACSTSASTALSQRGPAYSFVKAFVSSGGARAQGRERPGVCANRLA